MATSDPVSKYYDSLINSYDILADALKVASGRGMKLNNQLVADVSLGQKEAIALGKKLALEPADAPLFFTSIIEATTAAQARTLDFAQLAYQEALGAGTDLRGSFEKLVEANRETAQAAVEATRTALAKNPFADFPRPEAKPAPKAAAV